MNIYEFVTPSDPITFLAPDDKIAYAVTVFMGGGKAGCTRLGKNGDNVAMPTMTAFYINPEDRKKEVLGMEISEFMKIHKQEIVDCLLSFAYGHASDRLAYDEAVEAITDPEKLRIFKGKHEDRKRSSFSRWVHYAWSVAEDIRKSK